MKIHHNTYKIAKKYNKEYEEGLDAAIDGKSIESNPYPPHTQKWIAWRCGYFGIC